MRINAAAVLALLLGAVPGAVPAFADTVVTQAQAADDGLVHVIVADSFSSSFTVTYPNGTVCAGRFGADGLGTCPANGAGWVRVSGNARGWIVYGGRRFYGVETELGRSFFVDSGTAFALVNPSGRQIDVRFVLYDAHGFPVRWLDGGVVGLGQLGIFVSTLFPDFDLDSQRYMLAIGSYDPNAVMVAECSASGCEQR